MVCVELYLSRQVEYKVLAIVFHSLLLNLVGQPIEVGKQEFSAIEDASVGPKIELSHGIFERDQVPDVNLAGIGNVLICCVEIDLAVRPLKVNEELM